jgi:Spy/CpxP family protein refolding chaperone
MSRALLWKLIAGFVLVFIAGGVTGAFFAAAHVRHFMSGPPRPGMAAERMRERLRMELKLTPEQLAKISPIIDKAGTQLEQIRTETGRRVHETFAETHREISKDLTEEQRTRLQEMRRRHQRWLHRFHGTGSPGAELPPHP